MPDDVREDCEVKCYIGIDPGNKGALGLITDSGKAIEYERMPATPRDIHRFFRNAKLASDGQLVAILESGGGRGGEGGTFAAKSAGLYLGYFRMLCAIMDVPLHEVHPSTWKSNMGLLKKGKDHSIRVAEQLFPTVNLLFPRCKTKDHNVAEALLVAEYGRKKGL